MGVLRKQMIESWRNAGYCLVDNLFKPEEVRKLSSELEATLFSQNTSIKGQGGFGSGGVCEFPSLCQELNEACLNERLLTAVSELLGTEDVRLTQGDAWGKVGSAPQAERKDYFANTEQRMHMDFPNHDLAHPPEWHSPDTVSVLVYLNDANSCGGETGIVPREGDDDELYQYPYVNMPGFGKYPWINDKELTEEYFWTHAEKDVYEFRQKLYAREKFVKFNKGSVLFYRHDVWHRGRPILINHQRIVCNMVFKKSNNDRVNHWNPGFARYFYNIKEVLHGSATTPKIGVFEQLFVKLTPFQRSVLGFPKPGDSYWTKQTLEAAAHRWGSVGMDLEPYREAMQSNERKMQLIQEQIATLQRSLDGLRSRESAQTKARL